MATETHLKRRWKQWSRKQILQPKQSRSYIHTWLIKYTILFSLHIIPPKKLKWCRQRPNTSVPQQYPVDKLVLWSMNPAKTNAMTPQKMAMTLQMMRVDWINWNFLWESTSQNHSFLRCFFFFLFFSVEEEEDEVDDLFAPLFLEDDLSWEWWWWSFIMYYMMVKLLTWWLQFLVCLLEKKNKRNTWRDVWFLDPETKREESLLLFLSSSDQ